MSSLSYGDLKPEIRKLILETLNITDVKESEIDDDAPLFGGGNAITLDSVDALEIIMAIQRNYQIRIADQSQARYSLRSVSSIADFIVTEKIKQENETK
jgi:acyl carrier protein